MRLCGGPYNDAINKQTIISCENTGISEGSRTTPIIEMFNYWLQIEVGDNGLIFGARYS